MASVLLIEDEPNIAAIILYKLRREGHRVDHAQTAAAARELAGPWEVVLLDSSLPGEDALALLTELSSHGPVAMMTESRDEETPRMAYASGAAATVRKPFKPTLLARLVAELAAGRRHDGDHTGVGGASDSTAPVPTAEVIG